jgi:mRNA interferase HigB
VRILTRGRLVAFWTAHKDSEQQLKAWHAEVERAEWKGPEDIKKRFRSADFVANDRVVFNIKGNTYRLVVHVKYAPLCLVYIRFIGTHAEYDKIHATTV